MIFPGLVALFLVFLTAAPAAHAAPNGATAGPAGLAIPLTTSACAGGSDEGSSVLMLINGTGLQREDDLTEPTNYTWFYTWCGRPHPRARWPHGWRPRMLVTAGVNLRPEGPL